MSIYAGAIQQGAGFANLALGGTTAETANAYNSAFQTLRRARVLPSPFHATRNFRS